ncbi:HNH endonuclease signature motif containing protein [Rhizohabitans arisaemae]|uniref:HNH endonuclease signature motif containing protein n=1 Tax=Rhizohabitans arisaemae TaxID=2720610 RepID=UPI0024B138FF|nr:HNH endonuclease signature motif containing protein [Rhizohabitans arisaemae]
MRDRTCTAPGCGVPASRTDQDHIREWGDDGETQAGNLHCVCRHDHRLRHEGGWQVTRTPTGDIVWITRLGQIHRVPPPLIAVPLPEPLPRLLTPLDYPIEDDDTPTLASPVTANPRTPAASTAMARPAMPDSDSEVPPF